MRNIERALCVLVLVGVASAATARPGGGRVASGNVNSSSHAVKGYTKRDGSHVAPHRQTDPNGTQRDNYSSKPNVNPNTGEPGTKTPKK